MRQDLTTPRLRLRQMQPADAPRLQALCGNWNVARMLGRVPHPYPDGFAETWIAARPGAWQNGTAYAFAIEFENALVGVVSLERQENGDVVLGYWLGEPWWGQGLMSEAVHQIIRFAQDDLGLGAVTATYLADNPASGRVLEKCGFRVNGHGPLPCLARGHEVDGVYTVLDLANAAPENASVAAP